jgi:ferredoxin-NADP reductase
VVADGVVSLTLTSETPLPPWEPGAHIDLALNGAPTRQYSLCGDPADRTSYRFGILRDPDGRGSSLFAHDHLQDGDTVNWSGTATASGSAVCAGAISVASDERVDTPS